MGGAGVRRWVIKSSDEDLATDRNTVGTLRNWLQEPVP